MKELLSVFNSDAINKYNMQFTVKALEDGLRQKWLGGTPMHLSHDMHRPMGWAHPIALYFDPESTKLVGLTQLPENEEETKLIVDAQSKFLNNAHYERCNPYKKKLQEKIGEHLSADAVMLDAGCVAFWENGLATRVFPDLFRSRDSDGLIRINDLKHLGGGIFEINGLTVFAHPYFRKSYSIFNNLNIQFFEYLSRLLQKSTEIKIAIDHDLVGLASTFLTAVELEYWWGPKFDDDLTTIEPGVSRHCAREHEKFYHGISYTEFWWFSRKGDKTLEAEEVRDFPTVNLKGKYACWYVHSIIDESTSEIKHLDGAVRIYNDELMLQRLDQNISKAGRNKDYIKLWRLDANIEIGEWKRLISDYFRDNHLVGEYLGASEEHRDLKPTTKNDFVDNVSVITKYVPYSINAGNGIRLSYSYHLLNNKLTSDVEVFPYDTLTIDDKKSYYVDCFILEIKKILKKNGIHLHLPANVLFLAHEDMYVNLPLIQLKNTDAQLLTSVLDSIKTFVQWCNSTKQDRVLVYSIGFPLEKKEVRLSVLGHVNDLNEWFSSELYIPPLDDSDIRDWLEQVALYLKKYEKAERPFLFDIIKGSGILLISRKEIEDGIEYYPYYSDEERALMYELKIPRAHIEVYQALNSKELFLAPGFIAKKITCHKCNNSFFECDCSIVFDNTHKRMEDCQLISNFWTDRKA